MTEQEYINVRELSSVIDANRILRDICQENSVVIKREDYVTVIRIISDWQDELFKIVKTK